MEAPSLQSEHLGAFRASGETHYLVDVKVGTSGSELGLSGWATTTQHLRERRGESQLDACPCQP